MAKRWLGKKFLNAKLSVQTVTRSEHIKESKKMSLEDQIREVLFSIGKEIKILKIDNNNTVISIDYEKYVSELKSILEGYIGTPETLE
jgi:hypothetical protein